MVQTLLNYSSDAKDAKRDIQILSTEIFALKGILEQIKSQQEAVSAGSAPFISAKYNSEEFSRILRFASEVLQSLQKSLTPSQSHFGQSIQRLAWPLKKDEVQKQVARLERVKTWFIILMTTDNL
jgi:hypothetical protein